MWLSRNSRSRETTANTEVTPLSAAQTAASAHQRLSSVVTASSLSSSVTSKPLHRNNIRRDSRNDGDSRDGRAKQTTKIHTSITNILSNKIVFSLIFISILNVIYAAENRTNYVNNYTSHGVQSINVNATAATIPSPSTIATGAAGAAGAAQTASQLRQTNEIWVPKGVKNANGKPISIQFIKCVIMLKYLCSFRMAW